MFDIIDKMWYLWDDANSMNPKATLTLVLTLLILIFTFLRLKKTSTRIGAPTLPPGPRGVPVLGYIPFLGSELLTEFAKLAKKYGPIYKLQLGSQLCVVVSSPYLAKEVVRDHDVLFSDRNPNIAASIITHGGKDIAFSNHGPYWRSMRKLFVREMLSNSSLDEFYGLRKMEVRKSIRDVYNKIGMPIDIGELALFTMINSIMAAAWGGSVNKPDAGESLAAEFRGKAEKLMILLGKPNVSDFLPILAVLDMQGVKREAKKLRAWFDRFCDPIIQLAYERSAAEGMKQDERTRSKGDMVQLLLNVEMDGEARDATSMARTEAVKAILMDIIIGGTDTTATTVEWAMAEILKRQEVKKRVFEELTEVVGTDNMVEEYHLPQLKYLEAVAKETQRLHPALPLLVPRTLRESCILGGFTIPKGAKLFLNVGSIHKDPQLWDKPSEFIPERFLNGDVTMDYSGNNFQYMPFGSGRRMCAGLALAERMLMFVLASFMHSFEWELPNGVEVELSEKFGIVVKKMKPLVAIPKPRLMNRELYTSCST